MLLSSSLLQMVAAVLGLSCSAAVKAQRNVFRGPWRHQGCAGAAEDRARELRVSERLRCMTRYETMESCFTKVFQRHL